MIPFLQTVKVDPNCRFPIPVMRKDEFEHWMKYLEQFGFLLTYVPGGQRNQIYHISGGRGNEAFRYIQSELL